VITFETDNACSLGPPDMPTITLDDALSILNPLGGLPSTAAVQKFRDLVLNILWYDLCECPSGPQPTPPDVPDAPVGLPDPTGVLSGTGPSLPCASGTNTIHSWTNIGVGIMLDSIDANGNNTVLNLPPGVTSIRVHSRVTVGGAGPHTTVYDPTARFFYSTGSPVTATIAEHAADGTEYVDDFTLAKASPTGLTMTFNGDTANATDEAYVLVEAYCGSQTPGGLQSACCPNDQYTTGLLLSMQQTLNLIQRQAVPFAYVTGDSHAVSDQGEVAVQGILGLLIELDSVPSRAGSLSGHPETIYSVGWVNLGTSDGWERKHVIEHSPMILLGVSGAITRIGYSLAPDVEATITELVREP
jgi:hypothetical protein